MTKPIVNDLESYRYTPDLSAASLVWGEIALDVLSLVTASDLLAALHGAISDATGKAIVGLLLEHGLLYDETIDSEVDAMIGGGDAR